MTFSSLSFLLIFLPAALILYFLIPAGRRYARNITLLVISLVFYSWGEPLFILLICVTLLITYQLSKRIVQKHKPAVILAIALNLLPLIVFKYTDFFISNINLIPNLNIPKTGFPLPIGISFYTFQMLTYLIDLYRGSVKFQKNILYLALYLFLFPQLIAGPIVRYSAIETELEHRNENPELIVAGLRRFITGLSKKILIANQVGYITRSVLSENLTDIGSGLLWIAVLAYTIQIYFDFSGYSDMAIGLGKIFGFSFLENFDNPYLARSITDFWRRWHISMSTFFRDYIYIPLGGSRVKTSRWVLNMLVVWFLTGMWHGPYWNYIIWGLYYAALLIAERLFLEKLLSRVPHLFRHLFTLFFVMTGWLIFIFETDSPALLLELIVKLFSFAKGTVNLRSLSLFAYIPFIPLGAICCLPVKKLIDRIHRDTKDSAAYTAAMNIVSVILFGTCLLFLVADSFNPFIYFRF